MKAIVCVDRNWGIGSAGDLLFHIPADLRFFKEKTIGNVVVMGQATFLSLPGQRPLTDRVNVVLAADPAWTAEGVIAVHSMEELFALLERYDTRSVYICGGASVYEQLLPYCDTAYVTKVEAEKPADKFFPNLDANPDWVLAREREPQMHGDLQFRFTTYKMV